LKNRENFYWNRRKRNRNIKGNKKGSNQNVNETLKKLRERVGN